MLSCVWVCALWGREWLNTAAFNFYVTDNCVNGRAISDIPDSMSIKGCLITAALMRVRRSE